MRKFKELNPIQESILRMGKSKRRFNEEFDVNHPIGVLPHADAVATEQHIADRKAGLERLANPAKDPIVKEIIEETASEKSRSLHYDIVDRKGLSFILTEAKKNNQSFKVGRSNKEGFRYRVDLSPMLLEDINNKKDIKQDLANYINWCKNNNKKPEDSKSLEEFTKNVPTLKEAYKTPINDSDEYVNALHKAYKALKDRKTGYAAVYGYMKDKKFTPLLTIKDSQAELKQVVNSLKTREKGKTDVTVYTLFKNNLDEAESILKEKGLIKKDLNEDTNSIRRRIGITKAEVARDSIGSKDGLIINNNKSISNSLLMEILNWFDNHKQASEDVIKYLETRGFRKKDLDLIFESNLNESFRYPKVSQICTFEVYYIDREGDEIEPVEDFETKEEALKAMKKIVAENTDPEVAGCHSVILPLGDYDPDNGEEARDIWYSMIPDYQPYELVDIVWKDGYDPDEIDELDEDLDEDLHVYTSTLKDFKPAKEAKELWDEIVEKDKLEDLEYELENVFKAEDEDNASMDVEGLNDLLINHPDFIRTLISLDGEEDEEEFTEKPIDNMDLVIEDEDDEEPVKDLDVEDEEDEDVEVFEEEDDEDDELGEVEVDEIEEDEEIEDEEIEDEKPNKKKRLASDKKVNESLINIDGGFDENISILNHEEPKPGNTDFEDTITEKIASEFIKTRKEVKPERLDENIPLLLPTEDEEEIIDVNDEDINEALGMPSESK